MRFSVFFFALAISACATAPILEARPGQPAQPVASSAPVRSRSAQLLAAAGGANAPREEEIRSALGEPAIARRHGAGAALTYRFENCGLLLLFERDPQNTLRLAEVHTSSRRAGVAAPTLDVCVAEMR